VLGDGLLVLRGGEEPVAGGVGVGERFLRGEGLRGDDEEGGFGIEFLQCLGDVGAVDVGDEVGARAVAAIGFQRLGDHDGAEVGAADADVDEVGDGLAGVAFPRAGADGLGEVLHVVEHGVDLGHDVLAVDEDGGVGAVAQRDMEDGAVFRDVDFFAAEHLLRHVGDVAFDREGAEEFHGFADDAVLGVVEVEAVELEGELFRAVGVEREEVAHFEFLGGVVVLQQVLPGGEGGDGAHDELRI
jgi:hypothetical protein